MFGPSGDEEVKMVNGLEGVVVAETELSSVDGEAGELLIRGWSVGELASSASFEEVCGLMWSGRRDAPVDLGPARVAAFEARTAFSTADGMEALRAAMARLTDDDPTAVTGAVAVHAAAWSREVRGLAALAPDPRLSHAEDYLRMVHGVGPSRRAVAAMDAYFAAVVDHGMNASTFAARVVASTDSDLVSAIVAALGALKGRLHGGAPGPVLDMLDAIGEADAAEAWIAAALERGERIMGMGHRVYRVRDPRAAVLEGALEGLVEGPTPRLALAKAVEESAQRVLSERKPGRPIRANVEFYTAILLEALGLPRELFTPTFASARVAGWCAHVAEQRGHGRLIRPRAIYVGDRRG